MENTTQPTDPKPVENSPAPPKRSLVQYILLEGGIVVVLLIIVGIVILNPFKGLSLFPKNYKVPADMTKSMGPDGKIINLDSKNAPKAPIYTTTIAITEKGFSPKEASGAATGTLITFVNNSAEPVTVKFSDKSFPEAKIGSISSWNYPLITKKGTFTFTVVGKDATGKITIE